jgi:hypothetical protein
VGWETCTGFALGLLKTGVGSFLAGADLAFAGCFTAAFLTGAAVALTLTGAFLATAFTVGLGAGLETFLTGDFFTDDFAIAAFLTFVTGTLVLEILTAAFFAGLAAGFATDLEVFLAGIFLAMSGFQKSSGEVFRSCNKWQFGRG